MKLPTYTIIMDCGEEIARAIDARTFFEDHLEFVGE